MSYQDPSSSQPSAAAGAETPSDSTAPSNRAPAPEVDLGESVAKLRGSVRGVRELLDELIPPEVTTIEDWLGNTYRIRTRRPAKQQVVVMRVLTAAIDDASDSAELIYEALQAGDIAGATASILDLAADEDFLAAISKAFRMAHRRVVQQGIAATKAAIEADPEVLEDLQMYDDDDKPIPVDLDEASTVFEAEEMLAGLLPFLLRLLRRLLGMAEETVTAESA